MANVTEEECDIILYRVQTKSTKTIRMRTSGVLRLGRGMANDFVLDFNGVSVFHCELYLRPSPEGPGHKPILCIKDTSKNGTAIRPSSFSNVNSQNPSSGRWEHLEPHVIRVMEHGWEMMVPARSQKEKMQLPEAWRTLMVFIGEKPAALNASNDPDKLPVVPTRGPVAQKPIAPAFGQLPDVPKEAVRPPPEQAAAAEGKKDKRRGESAEEDRKDKKVKKDKKAKKDKKDKKDKKNKRFDRDPSAEERRSSVASVDSAGSAGSAESVASGRSTASGDSAEEDERRREREELDRLNQELENELAVDYRRARARKREQDDDDGRHTQSGASVSAASARSAGSAGSAEGDDDDEDDEDAELKSAYSRALAPRKPAAAPAAATAAAGASGALVVGGDSVASVSAKATVASGSATSLPTIPLVVEILDSPKGHGIYLRYGTHSGQPVYRRLKSEQERVLLYFYDGNGEESVAGWYVAVNFDEKGQDEYREFWKTTSPTLPVRGSGECGGRMEVRGQLDGPALTALSELPAKLQTHLKDASKAAVAGGEGMPEEPREEMDVEPPMAAPPAEAPTAPVVEEAQKDTQADAAMEDAVPTPTQEKPASAQEERPAEDEVPPTAPAASPSTPQQGSTKGEVPSVPAESPKVSTPAEDKVAAAPSPEAAAPSAEPMEVDEAAVQEPVAAGDKADGSAPAVAEQAPEGTEGQVAEAVRAEGSQPSAAQQEEETKVPIELAKPPGEEAEEDGQSEAARRAAAAEVQEEERESVQSDALKATTGAAVKARESGRSKQSGLTAEALKTHTMLLAKEQAEAYAGTLAQARSHYTKSIAGKSIPGRTVGGVSIAGRSIAGRSMAGRSVAGKSIAASGIAPSVRTAMTGRELLVNNSEMREIMRSVSPISEPGVPLRKATSPREDSPSQQKKRRVRRRKKPEASGKTSKKKRREPTPPTPTPPAGDSLTKEQSESPVPSPKPAKGKKRRSTQEDAGRKRRHR